MLVMILDAVFYLILNAVCDVVEVDVFFVVIFHVCIVSPS